MAVVIFLQQFWTEINTHSVTTPTIISTNIPNDSGGQPGQKLRFLRGSVEWGETELIEIFVRECYAREYIKLTQLVSDAQGERRYVSVFGSSGIGKSVFIPFFILEVMRSRPPGTRPTFCLKNEQKRMHYLHYTEDPDTQSWIPTVIAITEKSLLMEQPDYFISDTFADLDYRPRVLYLHLTSVKGQNPFRKKVQFPRENHSFPPFSWNEYLMHSGTRNETNTIWTNRNELQLKYDLFGGCLRLLKEVEKITVEVEGDLYTIVLEELNSFLFQVYDDSNQVIVDKDAGGDYINTPYTQLVSMCAVTIADELSSIRTQSEDQDAAYIQGAKFKTLFRHLYPDAMIGNIGTLSYHPSSLFLQYLGATLIQKQECILWSKLKQLFSGMGYFFEKMAHDEVYRKLRSPTGLISHRITRRREATIVHESNTFTCPLIRKRFIRSVDDIRNLQPHEYGIPIVSNFPLVDAVILENPGEGHILLQFTTSDSHYNQLTPQTLDHFYTQFHHLQIPNPPDHQNRLQLIYVVPSHVYGKFKADPDLPIERFEQFKVKSEVVAERSVGEV